MVPIFESHYKTKQDMKQATYTYKTRNYNFNCTVTLKNDGKVSHSLGGMDSYNSCGADRYQAKELGKAIVAADFKHESIIRLIDEDNSKLILELKHHTQDLKESYLELTEKYAREKFASCEAIYPLTYQEKLEKFGVWNKKPNYELPRIADQFGRKVYQMKDVFEISEWGTKQINEANQIVGCWGLEEFLRREIKDATEHYNSSIDKLASRLKSKGINEETEFVVKSGRVGMNFECIINHDNQTTKAWTIIASGPVQRPHYRYLVK